MQRELKFKAKNKKGNWIFGMPTYDFIYIINEDQYDSVDNYEIIPETLCQYSGMKDKNGVEAFEGDYDKNGNILIFCEECHGWQFGQLDTPSKEVVFCNNCEGNFMFLDHLPDFEIIGNIHD